MAQARLPFLSAGVAFFAILSIAPVLVTALSRSYLWLSDGTVAGYRDLDTGIDVPFSEEFRPLMSHLIADWLTAHGLACAGIPAEPIAAEPHSEAGIRGWFGRRRARREHSRAVAAHENWRLDHPLWRVPTDPPHGGWRDLVRNEPGQALWQRAADLPPRWFNLSARKELRAWTTGAAGEATVAAELWRLARPGGWRYIHSMPVGSQGGADIDHVLIGPGGVLTINTKAHRNASIWVGGNTFMVNEQKYPYLRNSRHEADRASRLLSAATGTPVAAHPLIVVVDPRSITLRNPPTDVTVISRRQLKRWISAMTPIQSPDQVDAHFCQARRSTTWS